MTIANLPTFYSMKFTESDGSLTGDSNLYLDQSFQTLNQIVNFFNQGMQLPQKTTAEIAVYAADTAIPNGTVWFNKSISKLQVKTAAGTIETITSV